MKRLGQIKTSPSAADAGISARAHMNKWVDIDQVPIC